MSFNTEIAVCICHGLERLIVNRTYWLCKQGNEERLKKNRGGSEKVHKGFSKKQSPLKQSAIKKRKGKGEASYSRAVKEVVEARGSLCTGCNSSLNTTPSHLVPRSWNRDLIDIPENIKPHCITIGGRVGCHEKWESHSMRMELLDYHENMMIVKKLDIKYFNLIKMKMKDSI